MYAAYLALTFALVLTPGATTAVVVRNTLARGWRGGVWAAAGAAVGNTSHAVAAALGLAVVMAQSPRAFTAIQIAGGVYLAWLAFRSVGRILRHEAVPASHTILGARVDAVPRQAWREGVAVNLLSPTIATFYVAVVPSFVPSAAPAGYYAALAATHVGLAFVVHTGWAVSLDRLRHLLARPRARLALEAVTAVSLALLAVRVIATAVTSN